MNDSKRKSLLKAITWQLLGLLTSFAISWMYLESAAEAGGMTMVLSTTAFAMYFLHERVWTKFNP
jgi:uncharacterized membrane protein